MAGYKIRGALKERFGQLMEAEGAQQVLRQYLGVDDTVSVSAKEFVKMVNALSIFTGA